MAITSGITNNYMLGLAKKLYNHTVTTGDVFKMMLLDNTASRDMDTTVYSAVGEIVGTNYVAKGVTVASVTPVLAGSSGTGLRKVLFDWADAAFTTVTLTALRGLAMLNTTVSDTVVFNVDLGGDNAVTAGDVNVIMPAAASTTAIMRF